jgi:hypothetical protein
METAPTIFFTIWNKKTSKNVDRLLGLSSFSEGTWVYLSNITFMENETRRRGGCILRRSKQ